METPLNASASTAGELFASSTFEIPEFQREYSWGKGEVQDFFADLKANLLSPSYFLGLVILTNNKPRRYVVDGQQRLITLSLLAAALYQESMRLGRTSLAERIRSGFLQNLDYETDEKLPRLLLAGAEDNRTFQQIIQNAVTETFNEEDNQTSANITRSYDIISKELRKDLKSDPFKRLGIWTEFLTNHIYFAVFVHSDISTAYQVYEVINTRGKDLTTADLLKNHVIYQTSPENRRERYLHWKTISGQFASEGSNNFVQYIRHAITVRSGHILPKELYAYLSSKQPDPKVPPPGPNELMDLLDEHLALYLQMIDPTETGPASQDQLAVFSSLNQLGVIAVRPILLAMANLPDATNGMRYVLRLVARRIVVGNLGTGNVERKFGDAARRVRETGSWEAAVSELRDLNPKRQEFTDALHRRSLNKTVLAFVRRSVLQRTITPEQSGILHFIAPPTGEWPSLPEEDAAYWGSTIGNSILLVDDRRPDDSGGWREFQHQGLDRALPNERIAYLRKVRVWDEEAISDAGNHLALEGAEVWYGERP